MHDRRATSASTYRTENIVRSDLYTADEVFLSRHRGRGRADPLGRRPRAGRARARSPARSRRPSSPPSAARSTATRTGSNMSDDVMRHGGTSTLRATTTQGAPSRSSTRRCATAASSRASRSPSTTSCASPSSSTISACTTSRAAGRAPTRRTTSSSSGRRPSSTSRPSTLVAFGSTRRVKGKVDDDDTLRHLVKAGTSTVCIVGKSWDYHVTEALRTTLDEGVAMVGDSVEFLAATGLRVFFDAEHFFDGYKRNPEFGLRVLEAAADRGRRLPGAVRHQRRLAALRGRGDRALLKETCLLIQNYWIYHRYYLNSLLRQTKRWLKGKNIQSIYQFDNEVTAPLWGFKDAEEYYRVSSSQVYIPHIKVPTIMLFSRDDPFVNYKKLEKISVNAEVFLTDFGGHMAFLRWLLDGKIFWMDEQILKWVNSEH